MNPKKCLRFAARALAAGAGLAVASYATYVVITWIRYGNVKRPMNPAEEDSLLDQFMPTYEVVERQQVHVAAPADITFSVACEQDLQDSAIIKGIFKAREVFFGSKPNDKTLPRGLLAQTKALGWGVLAEVPGREIVMGAVTQAWVADVVFRALPPEEFAAFDTPGYVKIIWTLRADPVEGGDSIFRTETRAITTDATARAKFRWYWSKVSPGVWLIRRMTLGPLRREAERRARQAKKAQRILQSEGSTAGMELPIPKPSR
jgi:hypothetical protein